MSTSGNAAQVPARGRGLSYWLLGLVLTVGYCIVHGSAWQSSVHLHTLMEFIATVLALIVGVMALLRFYSKQDSTFLIIGTGFLGTGFLDGYHALVMSAWFKDFTPSELSSLIPWSWIASRLFLAMSLCFSWVAWRREQRLGEAGRLRPPTVYTLSASATLLSLAFFVLVPLPRTYYSEYLLHRPEELIPALFFMLALFGYLHKGKWRYDTFEHWLVLALIVNSVAQTVAMSFSGQLFDPGFDVAHLLKIASYLCVLIGLFINMYVTFVDEIGLSERRRAEEAVQRYESILSASTSLQVFMDSRHVYRVVNSAYLNYFNKTRDEVIGKTPADAVGKELYETVIKPRLERCLAGESLHFQHWVELPKIGRRYMDVHYDPFREIGETVSGVVVNIRDITERKQAEAEIKRLNEELEQRVQERTRELNATQQELLRKERLATLGQLTATVSHELRNPLGTMRPSLYMLRKHLHSDDARLLRSLERLDRSITRCDRIIDELLDFTRIEDLNLRPTPIDEWLREVLGEQLLPANITLRWELGLPEVILPIDPDRLRRAVINVYENACQAMRTNGGGSGCLTLNTRLNKERVELSIADTGPGISDEVLPHIFEPLFSTKNFGVGLGLPTVKQIMEQHGGGLEIDTEVRRGTRMLLWLPLPPPEEAAA